MSEIKGAVTFKGQPLTLVGKQVEIGQKAPDFEAVGNDLAPVKLSNFAGKTVVVCSVPSLDTSVCATMTRKFNERAADIGEDIVVLTVSMDLPFAQKRWCGAEGISRVQTVSDHKNSEFGEKYGMLVSELRLLARSVWIIDEGGIVRYKQLVKEISDEPDYDVAMGELKKVEAGV